eukprot:1789064-Amphidinium_carterae.2
MYSNSFAGEERSCLQGKQGGVVVSLEMVSGPEDDEECHTPTDIDRVTLRNLLIFVAVEIAKSGGGGGFVGVGPRPAGQALLPGYLARMALCMACFEGLGLLTSKKHQHQRIGKYRSARSTLKKYTPLKHRHLAALLIMHSN